MINDPAAGDIGTVLHFDAAGSSDPNNDSLTYIWDMGDASGNVIIGSTYYCAYSLAGTYTVILRVSDGTFSHSTSTNVTIASTVTNGDPVAVADFDTTDVNTPVIIDLLSNDTNYTVVVGPATGDETNYVGSDLGTAVNNNTVIWYSHGHMLWEVENSTTYNGPSSAKSPLMGHDQQATLETTVTGADSVQFYWKASSEQNYDFLSFYIDGQLQNQISGVTGWDVQTYLLDGGTHLLQWTYAKDGNASPNADTVWIDQVSFTGNLTQNPAPPETLIGDALDNMAQSWGSSGDAPWYSQSTEYFADTDAAQSGVVTPMGHSWFETSVTDISSVSYYWKVSSEANYDYLRFYIDGAEQAKISGNVPWQQRTYAIPSGTHILRWSYTKDVGVDDPVDAGWVDQIIFVN